MYEKVVYYQPLNFTEDELELVYTPFVHTLYIICREYLSHKFSAGRFMLRQNR